jgi:RimJ/RimL family protein N-acetyltransferase
MGKGNMSDEDTVRIEPWEEGDLPILEKTLGDPEMTKYLGGPESGEKLAERQHKFERLADSGTGRMFKVIDQATGEAVGSVGYWDRTEGGEEVYETGWFVIPAFQGRGIATSATALAIERARSDGKHRLLYAYPSVENLASNAICRKLGFTLIEDREFEYPPGSFMRCSVWRLGLFAAG